MATEEAAAAPGPDRSRSGRLKQTFSGASLGELLLGGAHLAALWAFAFVQPLLDLLGQNADFWVARQNTKSDILIFSIGFTVLPPLIALLVEAVVKLVSDAAYRVLHLTLVALLFAVFAVQIEKRIFSGPAGLMILIALALGALFAWGLYRKGFVKQLLDVLTPAPILFLVLFIFFSNTHKLIFPAEDASALGVKVPSNTPIVEVVFDEFPTATLMDPSGKRIDARRFPGFAELAKGSTWYRDNSTVADFTGRAVPAIETGNNPDFTHPADLLRSAEQHLQPARRAVQAQRRRAGHRRLPALAVPRQRGDLRPGIPARPPQEPHRRPLDRPEEALPTAVYGEQAARRERHVRGLRQQRRRRPDGRQLRPGPLRATERDRVPGLPRPDPQAGRPHLQLHPHGAAARALPLPARRPLLQLHADLRRGRPERAEVGDRAGRRWRRPGSGTTSRRATPTA